MAANCKWFAVGGFGRGRFVAWASLAESGLGLKLWTISSLLSSIALGAITVFGFKLYEARHIRLLNAFTGAYLLTLTFRTLLPELYHEPGDHAGHAAHGALWIGGLMLVGFFVQIALDVISMGVEHGHSHPLHGKMPFGVVAGLCLHALVEAMALGTGMNIMIPRRAACCS